VVSVFGSTCNLDKHTEKISGLLVNTLFRRKMKKEKYSLKKFQQAEFDLQVLSHIILLKMIQLS